MARRLPLLLVASATTALVLAGPAGAAAPDAPVTQQTGLRDIKAPEAWALGTGAGIKVAVVSTGIAKAHPDLTAKTDTGFAAAGGDPTSDTDGRGTHLAGIVGADTRNGTGMSGTAPDARLVPYKAFGSAGSLDADQYLQALSEAGKAAQVVLVDLPSSFPDGKREALRGVLGALGGRGVSVVVGQSGIPVADLPVLAVSTGTPAGDAVAAPGAVYSTTVDTSGLPLANPPDYDYGTESGSNRSAALVAGGVAILRGLGASSGDAAKFLRTTKAPTTGFIDVAAAAAAFKAPPPPPPPPPSTTTTTKKPPPPPPAGPTNPGAGATPPGLGDTSGFTGPLSAEPLEPGEGENPVVPPGAEELYETADSGGPSAPAADDRPLGLLAVGLGLLCGVGGGLSLTFRRLAGVPL